VPLVLSIINAMRLLVVVDALASWLLDESQFPRTITRPLLAPLYAPLRALLGPFTGRVDAAPLVVIIALTMLSAVLRRRRQAP
jgi:uncharacterized protein YggT (Ycf19 family)